MVRSDKPEYITTTLRRRMAESLPSKDQVGWDILRLQERKVKPMVLEYKPSTALVHCGGVVSV